MSVGDWSDTDKSLKGSFEHPIIDYNLADFCNGFSISPLRMRQLIEAVANIDIVAETVLAIAEVSEGEPGVYVPKIILWCLRWCPRWYGSTPMSYANINDMLVERGISVERSTIYRWFIEYSLSLRKKLRHYQFINTDSSWQLDETYVKVKGKWFYFYRAIDKQGNTLDFYFSKKRNNHFSISIP